MKRINLYLYIFLFLIIQVIFTDTIIYFFGASYLAANIIALGLNTIISFILIKRKYIKIVLDFNICDLIFFALFGIGTMASIVFPDVFWDTFSYHLYLQENPFIDKIHYDLFPGRTLTSFIFPLADRVNYIFRELLGFRLGTIFGYFLIIVLYYQVKRFIFSFVGDKVSKNAISILSMLPLAIFIILEQLGTYYIDNFNVVVILELVYFAIFESKALSKNRPKLYYLFLLIGIMITLKITNLVYILIPTIVILIRNIKNIKEFKIYDYLIAIFLVLIPMFPYLVDSIKQTGSPVYPYYNTIFKSEYFPNTNWLDLRYGPKSFAQLILWPIYILEYPRKAYENGLTDCYFAIGYVFTIAYLGITFVKAMYAKLYYKFKSIKKEFTFDKNLILYSIITLLMYVLWAEFVIGYTRYAGILPILAGIFIVVLLLRAAQNKKIIYALILSIIISFSTVQSIDQYLKHKRTMINYFINDDKGIVERYKYNFKNILIDKETLKVDIDGIWGAIYDDSGVPSMIRTDDRIVHLEKWKAAPNELTEKLYFDKILNNDIYVPLYSFRFGWKIEYLNEFGFKIEPNIRLVKDVNFLDKPNSMYIAKVKYEEDYKNSLQPLDRNNSVIEKNIRNENLSFYAVISLTLIDIADGDAIINIIDTSNNQVIRKVSVPRTGEFIYFNEKIDANNVKMELEDAGKGVMILNLE